MPRRTAKRPSARYARASAAAGTSSRAVRVRSWRYVTPTKPAAASPPTAGRTRQPSCAVNPSNDRAGDRVQEVARVERVDVSDRIGVREDRRPDGCVRQEVATERRLWTVAVDEVVADADVLRFVERQEERGHEEKQQAEDGNAPGDGDERSSRFRSGRGGVRVHVSDVGFLTVVPTLSRRSSAMVPQRGRAGAGRAPPRREAQRNARRNLDHLVAPANASTSRITRCSWPLRARPTIRARRASLASGFIHDFAGCQACFTRVVHRVPTIGAHSGTDL